MNGPADLTRGWMSKVDSDLAAGRRILEGPGPYDTACFHAQQAIERYLKAVLAHAGCDIPRTHNLEELAARARSASAGLAVDPEGLSEITPFAVELRYDTEFWPERETAAEAVEMAEHVGRSVRAALPPEADPETM